MLSPGRLISVATVSRVAGVQMRTQTLEKRQIAVGVSMKICVWRFFARLAFKITQDLETLTFLRRQIAMKGKALPVES